MSSAVGRDMPAARRPRETIAGAADGTDRWCDRRRANSPCRARRSCSWLRRGHQLLQVLAGEIGVDVEPEVRRLDGDLRVQPAGVHRVHHRHVVRGHGSGVLDAGYVLPEMREDGSDPELFLCARGRQRIVEPLSRHERRHGAAHERGSRRVVPKPRIGGRRQQQLASERHGLRGRRGRLWRPYSTPNASSTLPPEAPALIA